MNKIIVAFLAFLAFCGVFLLVKKKEEVTPQIEFIQPNKQKQYRIGKQIPGYLDYQGIHSQLIQWNKEAPDITEVKSYGKSSKNIDIHYMRMSGKKSGKKVLLTACIHGNEWIANATLMGIMGKMLNDYGRDAKVTKLIDERDISWVPVVSPDSYILEQRHVDGVDPNRNFPYPDQLNVTSVPPIKALRDFFAENKFEAVLSGHAYGQIYMYPWGYSMRPCSDDNIFNDLCGRMGKLSGYRISQIRKVQTAPPYRGFEADWFYMNGAFSIVCEFGQQFKPNSSQIEPEVNRNYQAILLFIEEAPFALKKNK